MLLLVPQIVCTRVKAISPDKQIVSSRVPIASDDSLSCQGTGRLFSPFPHILSTICTLCPAVTRPEAVPKSARDHLDEPVVQNLVLRVAAPSLAPVARSKRPRSESGALSVGPCGSSICFPSCLSISCSW